MLTVQVFLMTIFIRIMDIMHVLVPDVMQLITITEQPTQVRIQAVVIVMGMNRCHIHTIVTDLHIQLLVMKSHIGV